MPNFQKNDHIQKWKLEELVAIVDEFENDICDKINALHLKSANDYKNILVFMSGKSVMTMKEIICLVQCGYPEGALSLARNLYEQYVIAAFFDKHKQDADFQNYIDDFYIDYELQRNKYLIYDAKYFRNDLVEENRLKQNLVTIKSFAHHNVKGEYWWAGHNKFKDMVDELTNAQTDVTLQKSMNMYHLIYKRACISLHVNCAGNMLRLGDDKNFVGVDNRPHENGHEVPLLLAVRSFFSVVAVVCEEFSIDGVDWDLRLNNLLIYYNALLHGGNEDV